MKFNGYANNKLSSQTCKKLPQPSAIKSLRSIINETKVPLADYINKRTSLQKNTQPKRERAITKTSYFQKLKGMINTAGNYQRQHLLTNKAYDNVTPIKQNRNDEENMQEVYMHEEKHLNKSINKTQKYRNTINYYQAQQRNRSKSRNDNRTDNSLTQNKEKLSIKPLHNTKTQHQSMFPLDKRYMLPPRPRVEPRKSQIPRKAADIQIQIQQNDSFLKENYSQIKQNSKSQLIQNIHSCRRLNFCRQEQRRKQIIIYGKKFEKICHNIHCQGIQLIQKNPIQISEILGNGAFSYVKTGVLKSPSIIIPPKFAIKIYEKYKLIQPGRKKRVMKEIQILSTLNHQNVIKLYCAYQNKREIHILFQQIEESVTLQEYFKHKSHKFDDASELVFIMKEVLKGLAYLHSQGIAHRDIKPDNILITFKGNIPTIKLIDFGFASTSKTSQMHCGTPNFMAPELFKKQTYNPEKVDMWAFGVMLFYLLEGKYPFRGYNQKDLIKKIVQNKLTFQKRNKQYNKIICQLLETNPQFRLSPAEVLQQIQQLE